MRIYVDTSAIFALLDRNDINHVRARNWLSGAVDRQDTLECGNYVLVESFALITRRLGMQAARSFQTDFVPIMRLHWVDRELHDRASTAFFTAGDRDLSLVDCVSFEIMRNVGIDTAFTFDRHFSEQGFESVP